MPSGTDSIVKGGPVTCVAAAEGADT